MSLTVGVCMLVHCPGRPKTSNAPDASHWGCKPPTRNWAWSSANQSESSLCLLSLLLFSPTSMWWAGRMARQTAMPEDNLNSTPGAHTTEEGTDFCRLFWHHRYTVTYPPTPKHIQTQTHIHQVNEQRWFPNMSNLSCPGNSLSLAHRRTGAEELRQQSEHCSYRGLEFGSQHPHQMAYNHPLVQF